MISNDLFWIDCPDGRKKLPNSIIRTSDIFDEFPKSTPKSDNKLFLYFDSIYIQRYDNHPLLEIGYSPSSQIEMINIKEKKIFFYCQSINYNFSYQIYQNYTCYDAECYFAKKFFTTPYNIIINYKGSRLKDDRYLFDLENDEISPFYISIREEYQLFYTFFETFSYVCMKSTSTLRELKDSLKAKNKIWSDVFYGTYTKEFDENSKLTDISKKILVFDFSFIPNPKHIMNLLPVSVSIAKGSQMIIRQFDFSDQTTVYSITCFLEEIFKIDRSLFIPYNKSGQKIDSNKIISPTENAFIFRFEKENQLFVSIDNKKQLFHLMTTIQDIQNRYNFTEKNFGIVINKHYVTSSSSQKYLIQYMNNGKSATKIELKRPIETCHICKTKKKHRKNPTFYIVPDKFETDVGRIVTFCLKKNVDFIQIKFLKRDEQTKNLLFEYSSQRNVKSRKIDITLVDDSKLHEHTVEVKGQNPRIIDLFSAIKNQFKNNYFKNKNHITSLTAFLSGRKLSFCEELADVTYDKENKILVYVNKSERTKSAKFKVFHILTNEFVELDFESGLTAQEIIKATCKKLDKKGENLTLFMNFNQLQNDDCPLICTFDNPNDFLIVNSISDEKNLIISNNSPLEIPLKVNKSNFTKMFDFLIATFCLSDFVNLHFYYKIGNEHNFELPQNFNAGSLVDSNCKIMVDYAFKKSNKLTFLTNCKKIKIELSEIDAPIKKIKSEILRKLNKFDTPINSVVFCFKEKELNEEHSFSEYKILEDAVINVNRVKDSFKLRLFVPEGIRIEAYVSETNTIGELKELIKEKFKFNNKFEIRPDKYSKLDDHQKFDKDTKYYFISKKTKIRAIGSLGNKVTELSSILTIKYAKWILNKKTYKNDNTSIFVQCDDKGNYEEVPDDKRLFEIDSDLFVTKLFLLRSLRFEKVTTTIDINRQSGISECNTVEWFKKNILSKKILTDKKFILTSESDIKLNEIEKICDSVKITTNIVFSKIDIKNRRKSIKVSVSAISEIPILDSKQTEKEKNSNIKKEKDEENSGSNENDEQNKDLRINSDIGEIIEEEEEDESLNLNEEEEDEEDEKKFTYKFQIGTEPVIEMKFKESATIEDAKIKIAKMKDDIDPSCVLILFAGKNLKKSINIKSLKLNEKDILQVYIRNIEEILLMTAKALRVYGRGDANEEPSEYEEEDYDDQ